jgi:hypothetical protein
MLGRELLDLQVEGHEALQFAVEEQQVEAEIRRRQIRRTAF